MLSFYFIRHAESEANIDPSIICGRSDQMPLSAQGRIQKELLAERLKREGYQFDQYYSSVSIRALETGQAVARALSIDLGDIQTSDQLVELSKGDWEGKVRAEMYHGNVQGEFEKDFYNFTPPNGESQLDAELRMYHWLEATRKKFIGQTAHIAVFSHGFAIKSMAVRLLQADPSTVFRTVIHNTSISVFQWDETEWRLERLNDHAHLAGTPIAGHY
ncbi:MAG: histidine phosphatase family protein [Bacteroidia bacterium]